LNEQEKTKALTKRRSKKTDARLTRTGFRAAQS